MLPDWVSIPGSLTYKSGALPIALRGPAVQSQYKVSHYTAGSFYEYHNKYSFHKKLGLCLATNYG